MDEPPSQKTFADQTSLLHHARRGDILHVAHGADAKDGSLAHGPLCNFAESLRHQALPPPGAGQNIADVEPVWGRLAQSESAAHLASASLDEDIGSRDIRMLGCALGDVGFRVDKAAVRAPDQEACYGGILC